MLSELDRAVLDFEASWWLHPGAKDRNIRDTVGISANRYYQVLRRLIDESDALAYDPLTVRRLRRFRDDARQRSAERRLGGGTPVGQ
jgi:hypothetical protein